MKFIDPDGREVITYGDKQSERLFKHLTARYPAVKATLARFQGTGTPDLHISRGDAGKDPRDGTKASGVVKTKELSYSYDGNWDKIKSNADLLPDTGKYLSAASMKSATLTLDTALTTDSINEANVAVHEVGHLESAASDYLRYLQLGATDSETDANGKPIDHDKRPLEREADQYRDSACGANRDCAPPHK